MYMYDFDAEAERLRNQGWYVDVLTLPDGKRYLSVGRKPLGDPAFAKTLLRSCVAQALGLQETAVHIPELHTA